MFISLTNRHKNLPHITNNYNRRERVSSPHFRVLYWVNFENWKHMFLDSPLGMVLAFILTVGVLVTVHECGHFFVARYYGVKVLKFSIGFGKAIFRWFGKDGTEYVIALIPLGGYVKMLDERIAPVDPVEQHRSFNRQPVGARIAIVAAGPLINFLFAILAYWIVFSVGVSHIKPMIGEVTPNSPAAMAGLERGQEIIAIEEKPTISWQAIYLTLLNQMGEKESITWTVKNPESGTIQEFSVVLPPQADQTNLLGSLGIEQYWPKLPTKIGDVAPNGPSAKAGLQKGDIVLSINGQPVNHWQELVTTIQKNTEQPVTLEVEREEKVMVILVTPETKTLPNGKTGGFIGIQAEPFEWPENLVNLERYNPITALGHAIQKTWLVSVFSLEVLYKMIAGQVSSNNLGGPIAIAKGASASLDAGFTPYFIFLALLSISLGLINLFPIPMLDGGHLLFYGIELVKGKPVSEKTQEFATRIGFILLMSLMFFAVYNDLMHLS